MATTGVKPPSSAVSTAVPPWSDNAWSDPTFIYGAGEASVTAATFDAGDQTEILKGYNFDFSAIPVGATIDGVIVVIDARYANALGVIDHVKLLDTGTDPVGDNKAATPTQLTTGTVSYTYGSSSDKWGNALTRAWVQQANFGVGIGCLAGGTGNNNVDVYVDSVTMEVYYTPAATGSTYNEDFLTSKILFVSDSVLLTSAGSMSLPRSESISESVLGTYETNIPLSKQGSVSLGNIATIPDSIFLSKNLALLDTAGLNIQDTFSLGKQLSFPEVVITLYSITGGYAFGEQNPTQGETAVSWQTWSNGVSGTPTISGDSDWGKLMLDESGQEARSAVYDLGSTGTRTFTLYENRYGTGNTTPVLSIRGNTSIFLQDDVLPSWEIYSGSISRSWRYVQVRESTIV